MSTFPEIYLEAVNAQARRLLNGKSENPEPVESLVADLQAKLAELDAALSSIKRQLIDRASTDNSWAKSARHAARKYRQQRNSILALLKTARSVLMLINEERARLAKASIRSAALEAVEAERRNKAKEREARIQMANNEQEAWTRAFKKVCKARLNESLYLELVAEANAAVKNP